MTSPSGSPGPSGPAADVVVVGAGPAGLATALALARRGWRVVVAERSRGRRRRLCGEFLSGDGWQALESLGVATALGQCPQVHRVRITSSGGSCWEAEVEGLGRGCSRSLLAARLEAAAVAAGVRVLRGTVVRAGKATGFQAGCGGLAANGVALGGPVASGSGADAARAPGQPRRGLSAGLTAALTLWAGGQSGAASLRRQRSRLEVGRPDGSRPGEGSIVDRPEVHDRAAQGDDGGPGSRLGVAVHGRRRQQGGSVDLPLPGGPAPDPDLGAVCLHAVPGGYVGIGPVEAGRINVCGLLPKTWVGPGDPLAALAEAARHNAFLYRELTCITLDPDSVVTEGGLDFARRRPALPLSVGDQASAPAPVLGQGLAAALCGGLLLADWADRCLRGEIDVAQLATGYRQAWQAEFGRRLQLGRWLHAGLMHPRAAGAGLACLARLPELGRHLVRWTRGPLRRGEPRRPEGSRIAG